MPEEGAVLVGGASEVEGEYLDANGSVAGVSTSLAATDIHRVFANLGTEMIEPSRADPMLPILHKSHWKGAMMPDIDDPLPVLSSTDLETATNAGDSLDATLPTLPPYPQSSLLSGARKRNREDFMADSSDPPVFSSDDMHPSAESYDHIRSNKRIYQGHWWDRNGTQSTEEQGIRKRGPLTRKDDSGIWLASDDQDADEIAELEEPGPTSQMNPGYSPFRSHHDLPLVPDPEQATLFEVTEVLPTPGPALQAFHERLATYQKAHDSHWFRVEDGAPGSQKRVRVSNADDWDGVYGKPNAAETVEYCVEHGIEVVDLA